MKRALRKCGVALTLFAVLTFPDGLLGQERSLRFERIGGLSQRNVTSILQDRFGFMWFGTEDGLNRYDGNQMAVFSYDFEDARSLSYDFVWSLVEDRHGGIWVGTEAGLNKWDRDTETFTRFAADPADPARLSSDFIWVLHESGDGTLWIGTKGGGLNRLDPTTESFTSFRHDPDDAETISHDEVRAIHEDSEGVLWLGTNGGGLDRLDPRSGRFTHYRHAPGDAASLGSDHVRSVYEDSGGALWVGTYETGLDRLDARTRTFEHYRHDPDDPTSLAAGRIRAIYQDSNDGLWVGTDGGLNEWHGESGRFSRHVSDPVDPHSLSADSISSIFQDRGGVLWVGTRTGGLNKTTPATGSFVLFKRKPDSPRGLGFDVITSFYEDATASELWVGTMGGGLDRLDRKTGVFSHYTHDPAIPSSISDNRVMSLLISRSGELWVGTLEDGLNRMDRDQRTFTHYRHDARDSRSLSHDGVTSLLEDARGRLWVGTWEGGLNRLDPESGSFVRFQHSPSIPGSLSNEAVMCLLEDGTGVLWVGTRGGGLCRLDGAERGFRCFGHDPADANSLSSSSVYSLHEDPQGVLWIGTQAGLNAWSRLDRDAGQMVVERYSKRDGLPNDTIWGVHSDRAGDLWISTNMGLSRFDQRLRTFTNYDSAHGLQGDEFNFGAHHRGSNGELFFGGSGGFNAFHPERVRRNDHVPPVVLTGFTKFNKTVDLRQALAEVDEITIDYTDYVFSLEFAALDFMAPEKNRYAYKLEGFNEDWIDLGSRHRATYTNLNAGTYTFRVKASNNDGVWNDEGLALKVHVIPAPWRTWWAYTLYALLGMGMLYAYVGAQRRRFEREAQYSAQLEREVEARTGELEDRNRDLKVVNDKLEHASLTDNLTGLHNRRYLMTQMQSDIARARRGVMNSERKGEAPPPAPVYLFAMIDLDGFKDVNDKYGHHAGDLALLQATDLLRKSCRESDTLIRWGGDEFLLVGHDADPRAAETFAERTRQAIARHPFDLDRGQEVRLSCSIGFAIYPFLPSAPEAIEWEQALQIADRALYIAKQSGRNAWTGILSTEASLPTIARDGFVRRLVERPDLLYAEGLIELRTSILDPKRIVWGRV